jgi:glycerol 2-dehydrogenase (NADP+)
LSLSWGTYHDRVEECLDRTLKSLGTDYLDLYLVHWPARLVENGTHPFFPLKPDGSRNIDWEWDQADTWKQMEAVYNKGKVKAIGVSNAGVPILEHISKNAKVPIAVNQVRVLEHKRYDVNQCNYLRSKFILTTLFCT